ncbi:MAG: glycosyltransferase [Lachnospiraceae bacterium]|nr:glycosyltransferase [Lachnospiraceae bacterium]
MKLSVVTVCKNDAEGLKNTMESVLLQTWTEFEYIVKDGGSTDGTKETAERFLPLFEKRGIPLKILSGEDEGIFDAMNKGAAESEGDWVMFLNAGDTLFARSTLKRIFEGRDWEGTDLLYGDVLEEEFGEYHYFRKSPGDIEERMPFSHQSVFARRELIREYPFSPDYPIAADYHFLLKCYCEGKIFTDCSVTVSVVTKDGVSSVCLKDTFAESVKIRRDLGLEHMDDKEIKKLEKITELKQAVSDYFPKGVLYAIRKAQFVLRGQKRVNYRRHEGHLV